MTSLRAIGSHHSARALSTVWLTPPDIIGALGLFHLDPCAAPEPRPWSTASVHWTAADNPLEREWSGRVWMNPPFSPRALAAAFLQRLAGHNCGTALLFARTETDLFFRWVWGRATALLFLHGRPHFHRADGTRARANSGAPVVLVAYGALDADLLRASGLRGQFVPLRSVGHEIAAVCGDARAARDGCRLDSSP